MYAIRSYYALQQSMTSSLTALDAAVQQLPASGATAVWDGIWEGLTELQTNGSNQKKAVVVLTDGGDNSSVHTPTQIIALAQLYNLRVFTIGLGSAVNAADLQLIALLTGGSVITSYSIHYTKLYDHLCVIADSDPKFFGAAI